MRGFFRIENLYVIISAGKGVLLLNSFTVKENQTRCRNCGSLDVERVQRIYFHCFTCNVLQAEIEKLKGENTDRTENGKNQMPDFKFGEEQALTK